MKSTDHAIQLLYQTVRDFAAELYPNRKEIKPLSLDTSLEKDLGLDSLARVELISRIDQAFDLSLPEPLFSSAETLRDLLRALPSAEKEASSFESKEMIPAMLDEMEIVPGHARTLVDVLHWHAQTHPERPHVLLYGKNNSTDEMTYGELYQGAAGVAAGLVDFDIQPGQSVAIMLPTSKEYFYSFFGILMAGAIPVPLYPPVRRSQIEDHLRRHGAILDNALASILITLPEARSISRFLKSQVQSLRRVVTVEHLMKSHGKSPAPVLQPQDIAFLQYTSGSTGTPKGVVLTHDNLLSNIRAMGTAVQANSKDVFVSWLPLYHDMGLIGAWLGSLYFSMHFILMSPLTFLARPSRWLWAIHRHGGTISGGPNFAYELCLRQKNEKIFEGLDLSSWRMAFNGAEPVSPETISKFQKRFSAYGFRPEAMAPVYGLAESSVGLAFPPVDRGPIIDRIHRETFVQSGRAMQAPEDDPNALLFAACGQPLPGHEIRIVDDTAREVGERQEGRLQFKGPSSTSGYFRNREETGRLFDGEWLHSGDRAYMVGGDVYLTGRSKDIIIRAGRNIYPHELEESIGNIPGIRKGCVAVFGSMDTVTGTEKLVILAETREKDQEQLNALKEKINEAAINLLGAPTDEIVLAPPHTVLKTSSGKIRRTSCCEIYEKGISGFERPPQWKQVLRLTGSGLSSEIRRAGRVAGGFVYSLYAWALFLILAALTWTAVVVTPAYGLRLRIMRNAAKFLARIIGIPIRIQGLKHLDDTGHCVLVVNHASYLDSLILTAALPGEFNYVAKRELTQRFISRIFLNRIKTLFVERFDKERSKEDAQKASEAVDEGRSLIYFPEGTFYRMPGLQPFRMGAFVAAAEASIPVVPVAIRGTRSILRAGHWLPRRGAVTVKICAPVYPEGSDWSSAVKLRDQARAEILKHCGEPDLC